MPFYRIHAPGQFGNYEGGSHDDRVELFTREQYDAAIERARREGFIAGRKGMRTGDSTEAYKGYSDYEAELLGRGK